MRICLLSQSWIADDPRVRRQGDALAAAGHDVRGIGFPGARSEPPEWEVAEVPQGNSTKARKLWRAFAITILSRAGLSQQVYWAQSLHRRFLAAAIAWPADLYLANDWRVLPIAAKAATAVSGRYAYDSHEYGVAEGAYRWRWRVVFPRYVRAIEARHIAGAAFCSAVGPGIAKAIRGDYRLATPPIVIRNVPRLEVPPPRPSRPPYTVLYHGLFQPIRGLEPLIRSVSDWRDDLRLALRGAGPASYERTLRELAAGSPAHDRIVFYPPAPMLDLVRLASEADIGILTLPGIGVQERFALPNKLFEYVMAGLAVCVTDLPDMASVVLHHDIGRLLSDLSPQGIALAVNEFDGPTIDRFRRNARMAALELNWERESLRLVEAVGSARR